MNSFMYVIDFVCIICLHSRFTKKIYYTEDFRYLVASLEYFTEIYLLLREWKTATNIAILACLFESVVDGNLEELNTIYTVGKAICRLRMLLENIQSEKQFVG